MTDPPITLIRGFFTIRENEKSISLRISAFTWLFENKNKILSDIKTGNGKEKTLWENDGAAIFTKKAQELHGNSYRNKLWIKKNKTMMSFDKDNFVNLLLTLRLLTKVEQSPSFKIDHFYDLAFKKTFKLETSNNTFTILDEHNNRSCTLPLAALEKSVEEKNLIYADLQTDSKKHKNYWIGRDSSVYTSYYRNFRMLNFGSSFYSGRVSIKLITFQKLVDLLGDFFGQEDPAEEDLMSEDEALSYGKKIPINSTKSVEFSKEREELILTSTAERKREVKLPFDALNRLAVLETKILADFASKVRETHGQDYFNEYWRNKTYAIRMAPSAKNNSYGDRSLRIVEICKNDYIIVMKEKAFRTLMKIYKRETSD